VRRSRFVWLLHTQP